ncbi:hypothetical protein WR25_06647 [Diploscapter pachys]|uniref:Uncharacterized protein n=1 Tax=Diploscapter pachys TaxID=2018661 RepID=A0A2A2JUA3_9BILA|nr:hypothetical protein WR25_06647 [Diploscapter pachys]
MSSNSSSYKNQDFRYHALTVAARFNKLHERKRAELADLKKQREQAAEEAKKKLDEALKDSTKEAQEKSADGERKKDRSKTSNAQSRHFERQQIN